ncbi:hypothetical protein DRO48_04055 [Candidatus Bathyarchaeota archaeon]|nr:MAG: hypothetical protein DRO48_04055 [Candidatus Bathyarchaeota archaeon]
MRRPAVRVGTQPEDRVSVGNPKLMTLLAILRRIRANEPINFYQLAKMRDGAYLTVYKYFKFCVKQGLLELAEYDEARGSKKYVLSEKGLALLRIFEGG